MRPSAALAALLIAGTAGPVAGQGAPMFPGRLDAANGLSAPLPAGAESALIPDGVQFTAFAGHRSPMVIRVRLAGSEPEGDYDTRDTEAGEARFRLEDLGTYSGGTEYRLTAWRPVEGGWIVMEVQFQQELGVPDFALPWRVFEMTELRTQQ